MTAAFSFASGDERVLDAGAYLAGVAELGLIVAGFAVAAWSLRRIALPGWSGPPAHVATATLGLGLAVLVAELLGTAGLYKDIPYTLAAIACGLGGRLATRHRGEAGSELPLPPAPGLPRWAGTITAIACALVFAGWAIPTLIALAGGMGRADTLWYHMPLSAIFVQTGATGAIHNFDPIFFAGFYPATSETLHSIGILAFARDLLSPFVNLGFLALSLVACWSIGRPFGVAPQALLGGAIALGAEMLVDFQAGEALNDIAGVAFLLCAAAILVNAQLSRPIAADGSGDEAASASRDDRGIAIGPGALAVAGVAAGLAASTKLSFVAPVVALTIGIIVIAPRGARLRAAAWWAIPMLVAGGYWYLRNLLAVGNPIPLIRFGPLDLPSPERVFELRPGNSIAHYLGDFDVWRDWFIPGFDEALGVLWPVGLILLVAGAAYALADGPQPILRVLGAMVLFTAAAYLVTPLTAGGEEGEPIAFVWNVRYVAPAMAVGLAMLPCLVPLRSTARRRRLMMALLGVLMVATVASLVEWQVGHTKGAIAMAAGVLGLFGAWTLASRQGWTGGLGAGLAAACLLIAVGAGYVAQKHFLERRYENLSPQLRLAETVRWARGLEDAKVGISGVRGVFNQYPFYGTDLSNEVQWVGRPGPDGAWLRIPDCAGWRQAINDGGYTHVVTMYDPYDPGELTDTKESLWTRTDPGSELVMRDGPVAVYTITQPLNPEACGDLPGLVASELNGESVNDDPGANQPPASFPGVGVPLEPVGPEADQSELEEGPNA